MGNAGLNKKWQAVITAVFLTAAEGSIAGKIYDVAAYYWPSMYHDKR